VPSLVLKQLLIIVRIWLKSLTVLKLLCISLLLPPELLQLVTHTDAVFISRLLLNSALFNPPPLFCCTLVSLSGDGSFLISRIQKITSKAFSTATITTIDFRTIPIAVTETFTTSDLILFNPSVINDLPRK
jgi:hypothetical protein